MKEGRSLAETPTYSVASVVTVLVFVCFLVERAIYRFGIVSSFFSAFYLYYVFVEMLSSDDEYMKLYALGDLKSCSP